MIGSRDDWRLKLPFLHAWHIDQRTGTVTVYPVNFLLGEVWEPKVTEYLKKTKGRLFIDIGANAGYFSWLLRRNYERVLAIEPVEGNVALLKRNLASMRNFEVLQVALAEKEGEAKVRVASTGRIAWHTIEEEMVYDPVSAKQDRPFLAQIKGEGLPVKTTTLDSVIDGGMADLVKIDVEGSEWRVLSGGEKSLSLHRIGKLVIELHDKARRRELEDLLLSYSYCGTWIDEDHFLSWPLDAHIARREKWKQPYAPLSP